MFYGRVASIACRVAALATAASSCLVSSALQSLAPQLRVFVSRPACLPTVRSWLSTASLASPAARLCRKLQCMASWAEELLTPGTAIKMVPVANAALIALMVVMLASAVAWPNIAIHLYVMTGLALGLFGSLNWVAKELQREKAD